MHPASYANVFTDNQTHWGLWALLGVTLLYVIFVAALLIFGLHLEKGWFKNEESRFARFALSLIAGTTAFAIGAGFIAGLIPSPYGTKVANMTANLKQKYDATLVTDTINADSDHPTYFTAPSDSELIHPHEYLLILSDGQKGTYYVQWDKNTSEPTIVKAPTLPTPDQLNQNANKQ